MNPNVASELRAKIYDSGQRQILDLAAGTVGRSIRITPDLPTSGYTLVNGYAEITVEVDSVPGDGLLLQLRIQGNAGGPTGEIARGQVPGYNGLGVYHLPVPASSACLARQVWLELFVANGGDDDTRDITVSWQAHLICGLRF